MRPRALHVSHREAELFYQEYLHADWLATCPAAEVHACLISSESHEHFADLTIGTLFGTI